MGGAPQLLSWKAIARHLGCSVRSARRWEREAGLPVHRRVRGTRAGVFAEAAQLDAWQEARTRRAAAAPAATASGRPSIAVLSFADLSAAQDAGHLAAGLAEEVTTLLTRVQALRVIARASAASLPARARRSSQIGQLLGARYLLAGSVRVAGGRLRVAAQLIDAGTDTQLWAEAQEGPLGEVFAIQERLARRIVAALEVRLSAEESGRLGARSIDDLAAYECYLRARQELWRWRADSIERAVRLLRQALAIIGPNARLYAALGVAYLQYREAGIDLGAAPLRRASECVRRLLELEGESAAALRLRGWISYARADIQAAVRDLKAALAAQSDSDTLLLLCNCYLISGRVAEARPLIRRLGELDPLTPLTRCMPAFADLLEGELAAAVAPYRQMFVMDCGNPLARLFYAWVLIMNGRVAAAARLARACSPEVRATPPGWILDFLVAAARGRLTPRAARLPSAVRRAGRGSEMYGRFLAQGFALAGRPREALRWLRLAVGRGFINYPFLARHDPTLAALRGERAWAALLGEVRRRWEAFEA